MQVVWVHLTTSDIPPLSEVGLHVAFVDEGVQLHNDQSMFLPKYIK